MGGISYRLCNGGYNEQITRYKGNNERVNKGVISGIPDCVSYNSCCYSLHLKA